MTGAGQNGQPKTERARMMKVEAQIWGDTPLGIANHILDEPISGAVIYKLPPTPEERTTPDRRPAWGDVVVYVTREEIVELRDALKLMLDAGVDE
jgi:hypothetical protein